MLVRLSSLQVRSCKKRFLTYIKIRGGFFGNRPCLLADHYNLSTFALRNREIIFLFIRLVVFKVKIMLLDFQTTVMLVAVSVVTVLSIVTLMHTDVR